MPFVVVGFLYFFVVDFGLVCFVVLDIFVYLLCSFCVCFVFVLRCVDMHRKSKISALLEKKFCLR